VEIQIRETNIVRVAAAGLEFIPYKRVQSCGVRAIELDGQRFEVLEINDGRGRLRVFEIAPAVSGANVLAKLRTRGIKTLPRRTDTLPPRNRIA
jgi:carbamoylphosphate synthase large subunit